MKRIINFLIGLLIVGSLSAQSNTFKYVLNADGGIKAALGATSNVVSTADYVIDKVGSTYYARPGIGTGYTAYSNADATVVFRGAAGQLTTGGVIFIKAGLYDNLDTIAVPYSKIKFKGAGNYLTHLKFKANADVGVTWGRGLFNCSIPGAGDVTDLDDITFEDLEIDGNGVNQSKIDNGATTTAVLAGILVSSYSALNTSDRITVNNCYIHDFTKHGVWFSTVFNGLVENCHIVNNYWNGVTTSDRASFCEIISNIITGSSDVGVSLYGLNNIAESNIVYDINGTYGATNSQCGIGIEGLGHTLTSNSIVRKNIIYGSFKKGIFVYLKAWNCLIEGNNIYGTSVASAKAISVTNGKNIVVKGNFIFNILGTASRGIEMVADTGSYVANNKLYNMPTGSNNGITASASFKSTFTNNDITITGGIGIYLTSSATYNTFITNISHSNYGILIDANSNYNRFLNNTCEGNLATKDISNAGTGNIFGSNYGIADTKWLPETGLQSNANTATADGLTTGIIASGSQNLTVTSNTNDIYIISLPAANATTIGTKITGLLVGAKICELRVQAAQHASVFINGVTTDNVEAALPAGCSFEVIQVDATHWILTAKTALGAVITAIVPDAV